MTQRVSFHLHRRRIPALVLLTLLWWTASVQAETKLDFWHSYVHQPSRVVHYSFQIAKYKRGIFFGSCGPSTRSLQWEYDIDLAGPGPIYNKDQIAITSDLKKVEVVSGTIAVDQQRNQTAIDLQIKSTGNQISFPGNGTNHIVKLR